MRHTQTSCSTWFLTCWLQTSGIYTLQIKTRRATQGRSKRHHRWWEGRLKEGIVWEAGELWKRTGCWDPAGIVSADEKREDDGVTPAGVWRACSLRRTSRRCCRTLFPSAGLLEPCNHECLCNTRHASLSNICHFTAESHTESSLRQQDERSKSENLCHLHSQSCFCQNANDNSTYKMTSIWLFQSSWKETATKVNSQIWTY